MSDVLKENAPNHHHKTQLSPTKKRPRREKDAGFRSDGGGDDDGDDGNTDWQALYKALQYQRTTKAEALLYAYQQESAEREQLMHSYNQDLENENKRLRAENSTNAEQRQKIQQLEQELERTKKSVATQDKVIQAYRTLTGTTLSNFQDTTESMAKDDAVGCDCTVTNTTTKQSTMFRISTVSTPSVGITNNSAVNNHDSNTKRNAELESSGANLLKYEPLQNTAFLPEFLHGEIEFESSELPPLLQIVLQKLFPDE